MGILTDRSAFDGTLSGDDVVHMVDVSDPTDNPAGSSFKVTMDKMSEFFGIKQQFRNGLTEDGKFVELGGELYRDTIITVRNNNSLILDVDSLPNVPSRFAVIDEVFGDELTMKGSFITTKSVLTGSSPTFQKILYADHLGNETFFPRDAVFRAGGTEETPTYLDPNTIVNKREYYTYDESLSGFITAFEEDVLTPLGTNSTFGGTAWTIKTRDQNGFGLKLAIDAVTGDFISAVNTTVGINNVQVNSQYSLQSGYYNQTIFTFASSILSSISSTINNHDFSNIIGSSYSNIDGGNASKNNTILSGRDCLIRNTSSNINSQYNSIISGSRNKMYDNIISSNIIGGNVNTMRDSVYSSTIIGGSENTMENTSESNSIIGSSRSRIQDYTYRNSIIGGLSNSISDKIYNSSIIGGSSNGIYQNVNGSGIIGSAYSYMTDGVTYSVISGGFGNRIEDGSYNTISGGRTNIIEYGSYNIISGGYSNTLSGTSSGTIIGGVRCLIEGYNYAKTLNTIINNSSSSIKGSVLSTMLGGNNNRIEGGQLNSVLNSNKSNINSGDYSILNTIVGGYQNEIGPLSTNNNSLSSYSGIFSGMNNKILGSFRSAIIGGINNTISGHTNAFIGGGSNNFIDTSSENPVILGGGGNKNFGASSGIIAGLDNEVYSDFSVITGSYGSKMYGGYNIIAGGRENELYGLFNGMLGGRENSISGSSSSGLIISNAILGGENNKLIDTSGSVILGGSYITGTEDSTVYVPKLEVAGTSGELVLQSPDGTKWTITIDNSGNLTVT